MVTLKNTITTTPKCLDNPTQNETLKASPKRVGLKLLLITLAGFGIGIGLTKYNKDLRQQIETNIPYSGAAFKEIDSFYENYVQPTIFPKP